MPGKGSLLTKWQNYHRQHSERFEAWVADGMRYRAPESSPYPPELIGLTCGAKTRAGTPCKRTDIYGNGRCKFHGGLSTGPASEAGKEQARINGRKGGRPRKATVTASPETEAHEGAKEVTRDGKITARCAEPSDRADNASDDTKVSLRVKAGATTGDAQIESKAHELPDIHLMGGEVLGRVEGRGYGHEKPNPVNSPKKSISPDACAAGHLLSDVKVSDVPLRRCADCGNLSAGFTCLAAARGVIDGGQGYRPDPGERRRCPAFIEQEAWRD